MPVFSQLSSISGISNLSKLSLFLLLAWLQSGENFTGINNSFYLNHPGCRGEKARAEQSDYSNSIKY